MVKRITNKQIYEKLEETENKIVRSLKFGRLDTVFAVGITLIVAGLTLATVEELRDSFVPVGFVLIGAILTVGTNIWRKRI